jgi:hypothetical protein
LPRPCTFRAISTRAGAKGRTKKPGGPGGGGTGRRARRYSTTRFRGGTLAASPKELPRTPFWRSSRQRESPRRSGPIGPRPPTKGSPHCGVYYRQGRPGRSEGALWHRAGSERRPRCGGLAVQRGQREDMEGSQGEEEALRRDPFRSFTCIDPSSKPGVTRPNYKSRDYSNRLRGAPRPAANASSKRARPVRRREGREPGATRETRLGALPRQTVLGPRGWGLCRTAHLSCRRLGAGEPRRMPRPGRYTAMLGG